LSYLLFLGALGCQTIFQVAVRGLIVTSGWTTPQQIKARKLTIQNCPAQGVQSANSVMVDGKQDKDEALSINEYLGGFAKDGPTSEETNLCSKTGLHIKAF
jgi:hypothetical protein